MVVLPHFRTCRAFQRTSQARYQRQRQRDQDRVSTNCGSQEHPVPVREESDEDEGRNDRDGSSGTPVASHDCANAERWLLFQNFVTSVKLKSLTFIAGTTISNDSSPHARTGTLIASTFDSR